jgi:hypothetical protein
MTNQLKSALTDIFVDAGTGAIVTAVLYFVFLAGGHSSPLGAAFGLGARGLGILHFYRSTLHVN